MPIWKLQSGFWRDSVLPRDVFIITPHFNDAGPGTDPQQLCDDLADAYETWVGGNGTRIEVKAYDAQGTVPVYPQGSAVRNPAGGSPSGMPREVSLCLSYYSDRNIPSYRGRLYVPGPLLDGTAGVRPNSGQMAKAAALAPIFSDLGGVDVDWGVYSRSDGVFRKATNWWVDDEWDTIRSRGLRSTMRLAGATGE